MKDTLYGLRFVIASLVIAAVCIPLATVFSHSWIGVAITGAEVAAYLLLIPLMLRAVKKGTIWMREVFKPRPPAVSGRVFYTVTEDDLGAAPIDTEAGRIPVIEVLGRVRKEDIGRRLYRVQAGTCYTWQAENDAQRREREEKGK